MRRFETDFRKCKFREFMRLARPFQLLYAPMFPLVRAGLVQLPNSIFSLPDSLSEGLRLIIDIPESSRSFMEKAIDSNAIMATSNGFPKFDPMPGVTAHFFPRTKLNTLLDVHKGLISNLNS